MAQFFARDLVESIELTMPNGTLGHNMLVQMLRFSILLVCCFFSLAALSGPSDRETLICITKHIALVASEEGSGKSLGANSGKTEELVTFSRDEQGWKWLGSDFPVMGCESNFYCSLEENAALPIVMLHKSQRGFVFVLHRVLEGEVRVETWAGDCSPLSA